MADPLGLISSGGTSPLSGAGLSRGRPPAEAGEGSGSSFKDVLTDNLDKVNELQRDANTAAEDLMTGKRADVEGVVMAAQKADAAFRMLLALRNKVQAAYEEIKQVRV